MEDTNRILYDELQRTKEYIDKTKIECQKGLEETRESLLSLTRQLEETREEFFQAQASHIIEKESSLINCIRNTCAIDTRLLQQL